MSKSRIIPKEQGASLTALDPRSLGRPFHLLPRFGHTLEETFSLCLSRRLNRRYKSAFRLDRTQTADPARSPPGRQFQTFRSVAGEIDVAIDRQILTRIMDYRYTGKPGSTPPPDVPTETETRLQSLLGALLCEEMAAAILRCAEQAGRDPMQPPAMTHAGPSVTSARRSAQWDLQISDADRDCEGTVSLRLDARWFDRLMQALSANRTTETGKAPREPRAVDTLIRVRLGATLLSMTLPLGEVLALEVGQILPVRLNPRADVHVGTSRLFTAEVADDNGRLCLTSFTDTES